MAEAVPRFHVVGPWDRLVYDSEPVNGWTLGYAFDTVRLGHPVSGVVFVREHHPSAGPWPMVATSVDQWAHELEVETGRRVTSHSYVSFLLAVGEGLE